MAIPSHRGVSNIRPSILGPHTSPPAASGSPHTPIRTISSTFGSPSTLRAEEECIVIEIGCRSLRIGFAGDARAKAIVDITPDLQRRAGDYRTWELDYEAKWRDRVNTTEWDKTSELWHLDLRSADLGLVGDKIERAIRYAFTKYLLIDSRPRRMAVILPSALPLPLLATTVNTLFHNFQPPTISLISAPVATTISAGLRTALVVDIGWAETVVTGVYEYREILSRRTVRASKLLCHEMLTLLGEAIKASAGDKGRDAMKPSEDLLSFEECEDVIARVAYCKPSRARSTIQSGQSLTVHQKAGDANSSFSATHSHIGEEACVSIPFQSTQPPMTINLSIEALAKPCEDAFFASSLDLHDLDDDELPIHEVVYRTLMYLPLDVRSMCMPRIIFTGGASNIPGLKERVMGDAKHLVRQFGWDRVHGRAAEQMKLKHGNHLSHTRQANEGSTGIDEVLQAGPSPKRTGAAFEAQEPDPIEDHLRREGIKGTLPAVQGVLRMTESLGAWSGASLLAQLKIPTVTIIEKDPWLQYGLEGATNHGDINMAKQRQSMGQGGLRSAANNEQISWTLGSWG